MSSPTTKSTLLIALGFVVGAVVGAVLTSFASAAPEIAPTEIPHGDPAAAVAGLTAAADRATPPPVPMPAAGDPVRKAPEGPDPTTADFDALLREFVASEMRRAWRSVRKEEMPEDQFDLLFGRFVNGLKEAPAGIASSTARQLTDEENAAAALSDGETVEFLEIVEAPPAKQAAYVASRQFDQLFQPAGGGTNVTGPAFVRDSKLPEGAVLAYPAGVFEVGDLSRGNDPFPTDVVIRGVGVDATLLVLDAQRARSPLVRFKIEDCTVFCDNAITDVRSQPAVLSLNRVRVVGFDCGAGGSVAFYLSKGGAMLATDCRFEAGYGRAPGNLANLMSADDATLMRFERCTFERMSLSDAATRAVQFRSCTMHELLDPVPDGPVYQSCRITLCDQQRKWDAEYRGRDLNDLFPQWRERLQAQPR